MKAAVAFLGCVIGCASADASKQGASVASAAPRGATPIASLRSPPTNTTRSRVRTEPPSVKGEIEPGVVHREVRARLSAIKACYERGLQRQPSLGGRLLLHWTIDPDGTVGDAKTDADTLAEPEVSACVLSLVQRWRFPPPAHGAADVTIALLLEPTHSE
jgi:hypothetical protein